MRVRTTAYKNLKSATIALQCCARRASAKKIFDEIKREQKDMGKIKEHNEKLKMEMASLKAMLQAQAASDAGKAESAKAVAAKQKEIDALEARIGVLEAELAREKENVKRLEDSLNAQNLKNQQLSQDVQDQKTNVPVSPSPMQRRSIQRSTVVESATVPAEKVVDAVVVGHTITPEALAQHRAEVARLEEHLEEERRMSRAARIEVKNLRSAIANNKGMMDVTASTEFISDNVSEMSGSELDRSDVPSVSDVEPQMRVKENAARRKPAVDASKGIHFQGDMRGNLKKSVSEYFPMITRGLDDAEGKDQGPEVAAVGLKQDVSSRKGREEGLRDEVRVFESKVKKFYPLLEEGVDVTVWQLNKSAEVGVDGAGGMEFSVKSSSMTLKLHRRGDLLVQTVLTFNATGGYLSKALGRRRNMAAQEPLPLNDIIEVKAGCVGFDHAELPSSSTKKGKSSKVKSENLQSSLFLTIKATPTPMASSRSYFLRLKSRSTRNDLLSGLRGILADLQVHEGVSISEIQTPAAQNARRMPGSAHKNAGSNPFQGKHTDIMVPLEEVHNLINRERESYDRLLLIMLQGSSDLKEKEDELLSLRGKLHQSMAECAEKDKTQANDSKLIMQLSKKLETLLMENEDLRDNNDRLNQRLVEVECEKMNLVAQVQQK